MGDDDKSNNERLEILETLKILDNLVESIKEMKKNVKETEARSTTVRGRLGVGNWVHKTVKDFDKRMPTFF